MTTNFSEEKLAIEEEILLLEHQLLILARKLGNISQKYSSIRNRKFCYEQVSKDLVKLATELDDLIEREFNLP